MMRFSPVTLASVLALGLAACGSDKNADKTPSATTQTTTTDGNSTTTQTTTTTGNSETTNQVLSNYASSSKMVQQSTASADESADMSETASTGLDDSSGTAATPMANSGSFTWAAKDQGGATVTAPNAPMDVFHAAMSFHGNKHGNASLTGDVNATVTPSPTPVANASMAADVNMTLVLDMNFTRTYANGETVTVVTQPNVTVTKSGRRDHGTGTVTRTINGTVHRSLSGAKDSNDNFDLVVTHSNTTVVDVYASNKLSTRTTSGTTTVTNNTTGETAVTTFNNLERGKPSACQCPTGGSVELKVTAQDGSVSDHTYTFGGTCGAANVDVHADVHANVSASLAASGAVMGSDGNAPATSGNSTVSSSAHITGAVTWADCAVDPN